MTNADKIASAIGFFYYTNAQYENEDDKMYYATNALKLCGIISITYEDNHAVIKLTRPGLFIGKAGVNINAITKRLQVLLDFPIEGIKLIEYKLPPFLYCFRAEYDYNTNSMIF